MQITVFQTDSDGLFLYETVANELPLSPGTFNVPYGAYEDAPPAHQDGLWPRREGDTWVLVPDFRRTPLWVLETGSPYLIGTHHVGASGKVSYPGWGVLPAWLTTVDPSLAPGNAGPQA